MPHPAERIAKRSSSVFDSDQRISARGTRPQRKFRGHGSPANGSALFKKHGSIEALEARITPSTVFAVTGDNKLISFDAYEPGALDATVNISGLQNGETIEGIDFRPADGALYALGSTSRLYTINTTTGAATQVGSGQFATLLSGSRFGFDFNPVVDRIRVISDTEQNLRLNPTTGALAAADTALGLNAAFNGAAYANNFAGATLTTLYVIDTNTDELYIQGGVGGTPSPNSGTITDYNDGLGVDAIGTVGFDIGRVFGSETALASLQVGGATGLYNVNLDSGRVNFIGLIGTGTQTILGIAISPAEAAAQVTLVNARTATFTDIDGDLVTVSVSKGTLSQQMFSLRAEGPNNGAILQKLDLTFDPQITGANVTISAKRSALGGDGQVNIGYIKATGLDLGAVKVTGDLARLDAGGGADNKKSIASLDVLSMGVLGTTTQSISVAADPAALSTNLVGGVSKITIRGTMMQAGITVSGGVDAKVGTVTILGDLVGGANAYSGSLVVQDSSIASLKITGSIRGGNGSASGYIFAGTTLTSANIGGSLFAGAGELSGTIDGARLTNLTVLGDMYGGAQPHSGSVYFYTIAGKVAVKGSLVGGAGEGSGAILAVFPPTEQTPQDGDLGTVTVGGSLFGAGGKYSGTVYADHVMKSATVTGSLLGGTGERSGSIYSFQTLVKASVGGNAFGGAGLLSGSVACENADDGGAVINSINVAGSVYATGDQITGIVLQGKTGSVTIGGNVIGLGNAHAQLRFTGYPFTSPAPRNANDVIAVAKLTIGGNIQRADIITGFDGQGESRGDAGIGTVTIGGSAQQINIVAAVVDGADNIYGTADDSLFFPRGSGLVPTINSIKIKGQLIGSPGGADGFVITAAVIKSLKIGATSVLLDSKSLDVIAAYGATRDITIREVAA